MHTTDFDVQKYEDDECLYCGARNVDIAWADTPAVDDDDTWAELAAQHYTHCEWIETRAHRIERGQ